MSSNKHHKFLLLLNEKIIMMLEMNFYNLEAKVRIIEWLQLVPT